MTGSLALGARTPVVDGWFTIAVSVENVSDQPVEGELVLVAEPSYTSRRLSSRAPLSLAARSRVNIELPTHSFNSGAPSLKLSAYSDSGLVLAELEIGTPLGLNPLLIDLEQPSRIAPGIGGKELYVEEKTWGTTHADPVVMVSGPLVNKGDLMLPTRAAGYASATLMLARSETLATLSGPRLTALGDWLLAGGALAVVVSRPDDLRTGPLPTLVGSDISRGQVPRELAQTTRFQVPSGSSRSYSSPGVLHKPATPTPATVRDFVMYAGGNLKPSPWGASASYGLGEVHLLAFDATRSPQVDDEWVQLKVQDLMRHAWNRQAALVQPHAARPLDEPSLDSVRKQLDPNEGTRWTIVISAFLLLFYAAAAGPFNFFRAAKVGKPLRAFAHLPVYALVTSFAIILLGVAAKGVSGRARHLSLIETGAGMNRAPITRFRGFYDSTTRSLSVRGRSREAVLDLAGDDANDAARSVVVDRDGLRLEGIEGKPWQTIVVREDDFVGLGGGLSVIPTAAGADVVNRLARDLVGVVVKLPGEPARYFARIPDGATVHVKDGEPVDPRVGRVSRGTPRGVSTSELGSGLFPKQMKQDSDDSLSAWGAISSSVNAVDWWPDDVPTLIGQFDGGEGDTSDSGLRLEVDRVLIRVVGWGGAP